MVEQVGSDYARSIRNGEYVVTGVDLAYASVLELYGGLIKLILTDI